MSNVVITGSSNGIGKAILELSRSKGYNTVSYDITRGKDITKEIELDIKPDILINCAGITGGGWIGDDFIIDQIKEVMEVNLYGAMRMCNWAIKRMDSGSIINIASKSATRPMKNRLAYCVSKGALISLSKQLALDLAPNIRVNSISPGTIDTQMNGSVVADMDIPNNLLMRKGAPKEVAGLVFDIAENKYITGQDFLIDGGYQ